MHLVHLVHPMHLLAFSCSFSASSARFCQDSVPGLRSQPTRWLYAWFPSSFSTSLRTDLCASWRTVDETGLGI